jgi:SNF2 family DNA or RNA helicase
LTALTSLRKICSHPFLYQQDDHWAADPAAALSLSGKLMVLDALLQQIRELCPDDKVVIVSNFTSALSLIESLVLKPRCFGFSRLDGSTDTQNRQALVDTFNRANPMNNFCFLLSSKAGGVGLNLVGANKLVMFGKLLQQSHAY